MTPKEKLVELISRRDAVDKEFLYYSRPGVIHGNMEPLAHMAIVGGRLDAMIRRELADQRNTLRTVSPLRDRNGTIDFGPEPGPGT